MIDNIKTLLGDAAANYKEDQISLYYSMAVSEVETYCNRRIDAELEFIAQRIAALNLLRSNAAGLSAQSYSGVSETYIDGYPADIQAALNRKRKVKLL